MTAGEEPTPYQQRAGVAYSARMPPGCFVRWEPRVDAWVIYGDNGRVVLAHRTPETVRKWSQKKPGKRKAGMKFPRIPEIFAHVARRALMDDNRKPEKGSK